MNPVFGVYSPRHTSARPTPSFSISNVMAQVPYALPFLNAMTGKNGTIPRLREYTRERVFKRLKAGARRKDLFYHLVRQYMESGMFTSLKPITEWRGTSRSRTPFCRRCCTGWRVSYHRWFRHNKQRPHSLPLLPLT